MKEGLSLTQLAQKLEDIKNNAKDFLVPTEKLRMNEEAKLEFTNGEKQELTPNRHSDGQIASYANVPKAYYDRLKAENPALLSRNVNHGLDMKADGSRGKKPETRLIRTYRDNVRALLSSSYRRLDSYDMAQTVLPLLIENEFKVVSTEITDQRMYLKALTDKVTSEVKVGDAVQYGLVISNSDVGAGTVRVEPLVFRLVCSNGMISSSALRKFHLGRNMATDDITELLTEETLSLSDQAFWAQVRDLILASMKPQMFEAEVNRIRVAASEPIKNFDIPEVVELTMKAVGVDGQRNKDNIVGYLANGADGAGLTKWGLINAFTHAAKEKEVSYDESVQIERSASKILDLKPNQWRRIANPE